MGEQHSRDVIMRLIYLTSFQNKVKQNLYDEYHRFYVKWIHTCVEDNCFGKCLNADKKQNKVLFCNEINRDEG